MICPPIYNKHRFSSMVRGVDCTNSRAFDGLTLGIKDSFTRHTCDKYAGCVCCYFVPLIIALASKFVVCNLVVALYISFCENSSLILGDDGTMFHCNVRNQLHVKQFQISEKWNPILTPYSSYCLYTHFELSAKIRDPTLKIKM
jgi:hypothetical protein